MPYIKQKQRGKWKKIIDEIEKNSKMFLRTKKRASLIIFSVQF